MTVRALSECPSVVSHTEPQDAGQMQDAFRKLALRNETEPIFHYLAIIWTEEFWRAELWAHRKSEMLQVKPELGVVLMTGIMDRTKGGEVSPEGLLATLLKGYKLNREFIDIVDAGVVRLVIPEEGAPYVTDLRHKETIYGIPVDSVTVESIFAELIGDQVET